MVKVQVIINAPIERVWDYWTNPLHIKNWYHASDDWHAPAAENDLRVNGLFKTTMAAKDGSMQFDFEGTYSVVNKPTLIEFKILDGRKVKIDFNKMGGATEVVEQFEPESTNSPEMQMKGWQAILDNFKKYAENLEQEAFTAMDNLRFALKSKANQKSNL